MGLFHNGPGQGRVFQGQNMALVRGDGKGKVYHGDNAKIQLFQPLRGKEVCNAFHRLVHNVFSSTDISFFHLSTSCREAGGCSVPPFARPTRPTWRSTDPQCPAPAGSTAHSQSLCARPTWTAGTAPRGRQCRGRPAAHRGRCWRQARTAAWEQADGAAAPALSPAWREW